MSGECHVYTCTYTCMYIHVGRALRCIQNLPRVCTVFCLVRRLSEDTAGNGILTRAENPKNFSFLNFSCLFTVLFCGVTTCIAASYNHRAREVYPVPTSKCVVFVYSSPVCL